MRDAGAEVLAGADCGRAGAAAPIASAGARLQPGAPAGAAPRRPDAGRAGAHAGRRRPRRICRRRGGRRTCAARSRGGAATVDGSTIVLVDDVATTGRDAERVRRGRCWSRRDGSAGAYGRESSGATAVSTSAATASFVALAVEPQPAGRLRLAAIAVAHARQQRQVALVLVAVGGLAPGGGLRGDVEQDRQIRRRQVFLHRRSATPRRAPALRRRRCSTRGSDRRSRPSRRPAALDLRLLLVAVGDVEQLHDVGPVIAPRRAARRRSRGRCRSRRRESRGARRSGRATSRPPSAARPASACRSDRALRRRSAIPAIISTRAPARRRASGGGGSRVAVPSSTITSAGSSRRL